MDEGSLYQKEAMLALSKGDLNDTIWLSTSLENKMIVEKGKNVVSKWILLSLLTAYKIYADRKCYKI